MPPRTTLSRQGPWTRRGTAALLLHLADRLLELLVAVLQLLDLPGEAADVVLQLVDPNRDVGIRLGEAGRRQEDRYEEEPGRDRGPRQGQWDETRHKIRSIRDRSVADRSVDCRWPECAGLGAGTIRCPASKL